MKESVAKELAFFGRITAGFTHEMKNVLAIIKESSGLMEDLLLLAKDAPFPHRERFLHRVAVIQQQVQRGVDLTARLNRFAHSSDEPVARLDLNEVAEQLVRLSERFARLKEVRLKALPAPSPVTLLTAPVQLQMAIFGVLESFWDHLPAGGEIELKVEKRGQNACLLIRSAGPSDDWAGLTQKIAAAEAFVAARGVLQGMGGEISPEEEIEGFAILFSEQSK